MDLSCTHGEELSFLTALDPTAQGQYLGETRKGSALAPAGLLWSSLLCHPEVSSEAATPPRAGRLYSRGLFHAISVAGPAEMP